MYRILAVDDSNIISSLVKLSLDTVKDFTVDVAESSDQALVLIQQTHYDLMIIDYMMPQINGIELVENVRAMASHQQTPIFILSANVDQESKDRAKALKVSGWISKPFQPQTLIKLVQKSLNV